MNANHDKTNEELQRELAEKIALQYKDEQSFINYMLETKRSFLYRYLETSTDKDIKITFNNHQFLAQSFESNMGDAFKISDKEIKEGIKHLAKNVDRKDVPKVRYQLKTSIKNLRPNEGLITIESQVNWGFPDYQENVVNCKNKKVEFHFIDAGSFRKELALNYEKACELFI